MLKSVFLNLLERYFRHRWLNLLPLLILSMAMVVYLVFMKVDYVAEGSLYVGNQSLLVSLNNVSDTSSNSYFMTASQATSSEIGELMRTDAFVRAIIRQTNLEEKMSEGQTTIDEVFIDVRKAIGLTATGRNQVQITATTSDPVLAFQLVNSLIENYIQWKMNSKKTESQAAVDFFSELITKYKAEVDQSRADLKAYISTHPEPIRGSRPYLEQFEIDRLNGQITATQSRYTSALDKEENAKLSLQQIESDARQTYMVIDAPTVPLKPEISLKKLGLSAAAFLAIGAILSVALVVANMLLDTTVHFSQDVNLHLDLPVLATIPEFSSKPTHRLQKKKRAAWALRQGRGE